MLLAWSRRSGTGTRKKNIESIEKYSSKTTCSQYEKAPKMLKKTHLTICLRTHSIFFVHEPLSECLEQARMFLKRLTFLFFFNFSVGKR